MDIKLDIETPGEQPNGNPADITPIKTEFLADLPLHNIAKAFTSFNDDNRVTIIPIGFPQAGKSMLLSSLLRYAVRGEETSFKINFENDYPFNHGRQAADSMVSYFEKGKIYATTAKGSLDLVGLTITPSNLKLPELKLAFLDLAGEDIQGIKTSINGDFTKKINAVFNGLQVDDSPIIFALITPFDPPQHSNFTREEAHHQEDTLHFDFLNYLKQNQPHLYANAKYFIIASQWDKNANASLTVEEFIKNKRPAIYNAVKDSRVSWGHYSVGKLLTTQDESGKIFQELVKIDNSSPSRLWKRLYKVCTNKNLDKKSFWEKLFS